MASAKSYVLDVDTLEFIEADTATAVQHGRAAEATEWPIEIGAEISDHVVRKQRTIACELHFAVDSERGLVPAGERRPFRAVSRLMAIAEAGTVVHIKIDERLYAPAILLSVTELRDHDENGRSVKITAKQFEIVSSEVIETVSFKTVKKSVKHKSSKRNLGTVALKKVGKGLAAAALAQNGQWATAFKVLGG